MLDDLVRGFGFDRALVMVYDESSATLRGAFGWSVGDEPARRVVIPVAEASNPIVIALRTGTPQRVDPMVVEAMDGGLSTAVSAMGGIGFIAAPLRTNPGAAEGPRAV